MRRRKKRMKNDTGEKVRGCRQQNSGEKVRRCRLEKKKKRKGEQQNIGDWGKGAVLQADWGKGAVLQAEKVKSEKGEKGDRTVGKGEKVRQGKRCGAAGSRTLGKRCGAGS